MSSQYKENIFSTGSLPTSHAETQNNFNEKVRPNRPNIDHLIKRILTEKRRERRKVLILGFIILSFILTLIFYLN
mgnify:CR=1 FL=1